jgi:threonine dehydrogenase-like Zn-dependent dehydrogenase
VRDDRRAARRRDAHIFVVDSSAARLATSLRFGADGRSTSKDREPVQAILDETSGRGVDVAIEALGTPETFESCLRVIRPGGVLSRSRRLLRETHASSRCVRRGIGRSHHRHQSVSRRKGRMRQAHERGGVGRVDLRPMVTHRFSLDQIEQAYELFANQRDGVLKVAIQPLHAS